MGIPPHTEGPCHDIMVIKKSVQVLESERKELEKRVSELERSKAQDTQIIKNIGTQIELLGNTVNRLSDEIRHIVEKPLRNMEKIKVGVATAIATAIILAWSQS